MRRLRDWSVGGERALVGSVFDDIGDAVTGTWDDLKNTVPGLGPISDALDNFASGPLRDFASTIPGKIVLTAVSGGAYMAASPVVGAQVAAAVFALPGMAKGDSFVQAWTEAFVERLSALISYFIAQGIPQEAATTKVGQIVNQGLDKLKPFADKLALANWDVQKLAELAGVREDLAAYYLAQATGDLQKYLKDRVFDPATGKEIFGPSMGSQIMAKLAAIQKAAQEKAQREASARAARLGDLGSFKAMLQPAATTTTQAAVRAAAVAPSLDRSIAAPTDSGKPLSTGAKVALGIGGVGVLALILRALRLRRVL